MAMEPHDLARDRYWTTLKWIVRDSSKDNVGSALSMCFSKALWCTGLLTFLGLSADSG